MFVIKNLFSILTDNISEFINKVPFSIYSSSVVVDYISILICLGNYGPLGIFVNNADNIEYIESSTVIIEQSR
jgi:hypothetical protein